MYISLYIYIYIYIKLQQHIMVVVIAHWTSRVMFHHVYIPLAHSYNYMYTVSGIVTAL